MPWKQTKHPSALVPVRLSKEHPLPLMEAGDWKTHVTQCDASAPGPGAVTQAVPS
jgi:hypothetical protein